MGKIVITGQEARQKTLAGVNILADAVKVTLGPRGKNVAIEVQKYQVPLITKDGVTVARHITLDDHCENMGAQLVKSVAAAANNTAGDGTTTATVLAQAIYSHGLKMVAAGYNPVLIKRGIELATETVVTHLKEMAIGVSDENTLAYVASISANNDKALGKMIAEAVAMVGNDGILTVEEESGTTTHVEYTDGLKLERGLLHPDFITNPNKLTSELQDAYILLHDGKIDNIHMIVPLLKTVSESGRAILIVVKEIDSQTINQIAYNCAKGSLKACVIRAPGFGDHRRAFLEDIAVVTGGIVTSDARPLDTINILDLGEARKVSVGLNFTSIIDGKAPAGAVDEMIVTINNQLSNGDLFDHQIDILKGRLSRLGGGAAIFKVGGTSDAEVREKRDRVEDAINAVRSAIEEGIVPGGGAALLKCLKVLKKMDTSDLLPEEAVGVKIVMESIQAPFSQIMKNAGVEFSSIYIERISESKSSGFDALKMEYVEDMIERGIIDPVKVVRAALEHAASASGTLLTTEVVIFDSEQ